MPKQVFSDDFQELVDGIIGSSDPGEGAAQQSAAAAMAQRVPIGLW